MGMRTAMRYGDKEDNPVLNHELIQRALWAALRLLWDAY